MSRAELSEHLLSIKSALVIDDHPLYCDALATTMESMFNTRRIRTATTLGEALQQLRMRFSPDLIILDLNLPDASGLSGFMKIKEKTPDVPVIVISAITTEGVVHSVMAAGAAGFIPKDTGRQTFQEAMRDIWNGKTYVPPGYALPARTKAGDRCAEVDFAEDRQSLAAANPNSRLDLRGHAEQADRVRDAAGRSHGESSYHRPFAPARRSQSHAGGDAGSRGLDPP